MQIKPHEIHCYAFSLILSPQQEASWLSVLNDNEQATAHRFRFAKDQQRYIAARGHLRHILGCYLNEYPKTVQIAYTSYDKPYLAQHTGLHFNVSHSHELGVIVLSTCPVGVDIEQVQKNYNPEIAARFFHPQEAAYLATLSEPQRSQTFFQFWARKEAILKAIGKGLSSPLASFSVSPTASCETIALENEQWTLLPLEIQESYASAVATNQSIQSVSRWRFDLTGPIWEGLIFPC